MDKNNLKNNLGYIETILDAAPIGLIMWDNEINLVTCNKELVKMFNAKTKENVLKNFYSFLPTTQPNNLNSKSEITEFLQKTQKTGKTRFKFVWQTTSKKEVYSDVSIKTLTLNTGFKVFVAYITNLSKQFINAETIFDEHEFYFNSLPDSLLLHNLSELSDEWLFSLNVRTKLIQYYGKNVVSNGQKHGALVPLGIEATAGFIHAEDIELYNTLCSNMLKGIYEPIDIRFKQSDKTYRYYRYIYKTMLNKNKKPAFVVGKALDIDEQKLLEQKAQTDQLTNCYNKISAETIISSKLNNSKATDKHALIIVDIDNFKSVNDNLGHFFGDEVLKEVSGNLKNLFTSKNIVARIGGDEFIVFVENYKNKAELAQKANEIAIAFNKTYSGENHDYSISGSIGIATYPQSGAIYDDLYKAADKALYHAKMLGKNQFVFYDKSLIDGTMKSLTKLENADRIAGTFFDHDLISEVFNILYERGGDDVSINSALKFIGQKYNADRSYIFETFDNGQTYNNTFEWCKKGISSEIDSLQNVTKEVLNDFFIFSKNGVLYSNNLQETLTDAAAFETMARQGIKSFAHAQATKSNYVTFFIGLDDCTNYRVWNEKEINSLQYLGKIISIMRQSNILTDKLNKLDSYNQMTVQIADNANDIIYVSDIETNELIYINKATLNVLGNPSEENWKGKKCYEVLQGKCEKCEFCTNHLLNENEFYTWKYFNPIFKKDYYLQDKLITVDGRLCRLEIATDVTKIQTLEHELKDKLELEQTLFSCAETLHASTDPETSVNQLLEIIGNYYDADRCYIFEIDKNKNIISNTYDWVKKGYTSYRPAMQNLDLSKFDLLVNRLIKEGEFIVDTKVFNVPDDVYEKTLIKELEIDLFMCVAIHDNKNNIIGFLGINNPQKHFTQIAPMHSIAQFFSNFLDEIRIITKLNTLSYVDPLTNTLNRNSYRENLKNLDAADFSSLGLVYLDIEELSYINDTKGTEAGDRILIEVSTLLNNVFKNCVYRVGGDEFVVLIKNIAEVDFEQRVKNFKDQVNTKKYSISMGHTWQDCEHFKTTYDGTGSRYKSILTQSLKQDILANKFVVYLQPQVDLVTGLVDGAEALIRKVSYDNSILTPIAFLPFYEKEGLIAALDLFVIEEVCKFLKSNNLELGFDISINCSRMTLAEPNIVNNLCEICDKYNVKKSNIIIEVTETITGAADVRLSKTLNNLKSAGFKISLDDFGSGYSNLNSLTLADFDELKIDMQLTNNLHLNSTSKLLTKVALTLCSSFKNLVSVAEGVECLEQLNTLKELGCNKGQGYYFGKPINIKYFIKTYIK